MIGAIGVTLGHDFPALLKFKGGKGIVCGVSVAACIDWRIAVILVLVFCIFYFATKYVSLGSVMGAVSLCICMAVLHYGNPVLLWGGEFLGLLALFMHRSNIRRLFKKEEKKTDFFGKKHKK